MVVRGRALHVALTLELSAFAGRGALPGPFDGEGVKGSGGAAVAGVARARGGAGRAIRDRILGLWGCVSSRGE